jgi:hypothetical protein
MYSIAAAAAGTGLSQTTLLRAIQAGHISSTRNGFNEWQVDPAELHRLYDPKVSRIVKGSAPPADRAQVRSGRAEAVRSRARLHDMAQAKRLSGLANSDQQTQLAARTRWWRLMIGLQDSFHLPGTRYHRT